MMDKKIKGFLNPRLVSQCTFKLNTIIMMLRCYNAGIDKAHGDIGGGVPKVPEEIREVVIDEVRFEPRFVGLGG